MIFSAAPETQAWSPSPSFLNNLFPSVSSPSLPMPGIPGAPLTPQAEINRTTEHKWNNGPDSTKDLKITSTISPDVNLQNGSHFYIELTIEGSPSQLANVNSLYFNIPKYAADLRQVKLANSSEVAAHQGESTVTVSAFSGNPSPLKFTLDFFAMSTGKHTYRPSLSVRANGGVSSADYSEKKFTIE